MRLETSYRGSGLGGTQFLRTGGFPGVVTGTRNRSFGDALGQAFTPDYPTWSFGVTVSYPLGRSYEEASLARAEVERRQAAQRIASLRLQAAETIRQAGRQIQSTAERVDAARAGATLAQQRLESEQRRYEVGLSTTFLVTQAQRDLLQAQVNLLQTTLDYQSSLVNFEAVQQAPPLAAGDTVGVKGASVVAAAGPNAARHLPARRGRGILRRWIGGLRWWALRPASASGPYDDGEARHLDRAPGVLRERGLIERLGAIDLGDVVPPPYRDYVRPPSRARNEEQVVVYSRSLAQQRGRGHRERAVRARPRRRLQHRPRVSARGEAEERGVARPRVRGCARRLRHADESRTGSVASMSLALASGRGETPLARLAGRAPLVEPRHVVLVGRRERRTRGTATRRSPHRRFSTCPTAGCRRRDSASWAADVPPRGSVRSPGLLDTGRRRRAQSRGHVRRGLARPGGPMPDELVDLLTPLAQHPLALGLSLTIYDPAFDPDRSCARQLVGMLEALLAFPASHEAHAQQARPTDQPSGMPGA